MVEDIQRACVSRGCQTLYQLQKMIRLAPSRTLKSCVDLLMSRLDELGLDVMGAPWPVPTLQHLLISEAVWTHLWSERKRADPEVESSTMALCLTAVGKLATAGIWYAAQLSAGPGLWLDLRAVPPCNVTVAEYRALITELRVSPFQERIVNERAGTPGLRQLTLWERVDHVMPSRPAPGDSNGGQNITNRLAAIAFSAPGPRASVRTHPWQCEPQLPDRVTIDFTHDHPELLQAPPGWELLRRNGRLLLRNPSGFTCQLEAAQAGMLEHMQEGMDQVCLLEALFESCSSQQRQDDN